jgi:hypothetical protein
MLNNDKSDSYPDKYWAAVEADDLVGVLEEKERKFQGSLKSSLYWERCLRNVAYAHGQFFQGGADSIDMEIPVGGTQGELLLFASNQFRNLLEHYFQLAARDKIGLKTRAVNEDNESLRQADIGDGLIDYYTREKQMENYLRIAAWASLQFMQGFVTCEWDPSLGDPDPMTGQPAGDFVFASPLPCDVIWNLAQTWEKSEWVVTRELVNRWNLVKQFPGNEEDILSVEEKEYDRLNIYKNQPDICDDDLIPLYKFFHKKTLAVPTGRYLLYVEDTPLQDAELPYDDVPVFRVSPGEWLGQGTGWSPANSLQPLQEMYNGELSAIASNHAAYATQDYFVPDGAEKVKTTRLKGGIRMVSGPAKPEPLVALASQPDLWKFADYLRQEFQLISGITGATRGVAETGVTAASAFALFDAKSVQYATQFVAAYNQLAEDVSTFMLKTAGKYITNQRTVAIIGKANLPDIVKFTGSDLSLIDRVVVDTVNPMTKTMAGKEARADKLLSIQAIHTPEEYINVLETGNLEPMLQGEKAQLNIVREENEGFLAGKPASAIRIDNHVLHIKEHHSVLGTQSSRSNPQIVQFVLAHIMEHEMLLSQPDVQRTMSALGYQVPQAFMMQMMPGVTQTMAGPQTNGETPIPEGQQPEVALPGQPKPPPGAQQPINA